eukprot:SAG31_NODE_12_length_38498_cov_21.161671_17_plen_304_part_00
MGFVHSSLLTKTGFSYMGLIHVSDFLPTLYHLAGGDPASLEGLDGFDVWAALTQNASSPRMELLHNIDPLAAHPRGPYGHTALRVGDMKLIVGNPGSHSGHYAPPGCSACIQPLKPNRAECAPDTNGTHLWLFDIAQDARELCNLAESQPLVVQKLLARLDEYNRTAVPALDPPNDAASDPARRTGVEKGSWGPWCPDSGCIPLPQPPLPQPTSQCQELRFGPCQEREGSELSHINTTTWAQCCAQCAKMEGCGKFVFSTERGCHLHTPFAICANCANHTKPDGLEQPINGVVNHHGGLSTQN